jgi:hypothetical protein
LRGHSPPIDPPLQTGENGAKPSGAKDLTAPLPPSAEKALLGEKKPRRRSRSRRDRQAAATVGGEGKDAGLAGDELTGASDGAAEGHDPAEEP